MSDFHRELNRVLRYSMDTVTNLLDQLASPEQFHTRIGKGDRHLRLVAADALQDHNRESEANLLRSDGHIVIHNGQVKPGRLTLRPLQEYREHVANRLAEEGAHHFGEPTTITPNINWVSEDEPDDSLVTNPNVHPTDDHGVPLVWGSTFTCHDFGNRVNNPTPINKAGREWTDLLCDTVFAPRNDVASHLSPETQRRLEKEIRDGADKVPVEEPIPDREIE